MSGPKPALACSSCSARYAALNLGVNLALGILKAGIGLLAGSRALLAGALYSVNDVLSGVVILVCMRVAQRPPDEDHAYGHDKAEFVATGLVSIIIGVGVIYFFISSMHSFLHGRQGPPHLIALLVALFAMPTNGLLAEYGRCISRRFDSLVVGTSAEHNHLDAISSLAVTIGVGGALCGLHVLDLLVAIFETVDVLRLSGTLLIKAIKGLMDTALSRGEVERIELVSRQVGGVLRVAEVRSRMAGTRAFVDVAVSVDPSLSVGAADQVTSEVRASILRAVDRPLEVRVRFRPAPEPPVAAGSPEAAAPGAVHA